MTQNNMEKTLLAFEYGLVLSQSAKSLGIDVDSTLTEKAEAMMKDEFETKSLEELANNMIPNILSVLEPSTENKKATD
jgi:hypothetical protein